jgi:hypothetical protein
MMRVRVLALALVPLLAGVPMILQSVLRAQAPSSLSRDQEIRLAKSAAPPGVSRGAQVYVLDHGRYVVAETGHTGVFCVLIQMPADGVEPECGDAEADASVLAVERFRVEQRVAGRSSADIKRAVDDAMAAGRLRAPRRPALVYMMSSAQVLYDGDTKRLGKWEPHVMVFYPQLQNSDLAIPAGDPDIRVPGILDPGTPMSALVVVTPSFVDPAPAQ